MPEPSASDTDPVTTITRPFSSPDGTIPPMPFPSPDGTIPPMPFPSHDHGVPPMPSEVMNGHDRTQRPAAGGVWRTAMMALRKVMRRTPRGAA
jgi:hypothetical protein